MGAFMSSAQQETPVRIPDLESLTAGLNKVIGRRGLTIVDRTPVPCASTYPSEIVTCRIQGSGELKVYCKYFSGLNYESYGHRGGVPYEAAVYRGLLGSLPISVPTFYGTYQDAENAGTWLILEYLGNTLRLGKSPQPESMLRAARWIGQFHKLNEARVSGAISSVLNTYTVDYYLGWVGRTFNFARSLHARFPWLQVLCEHFGEIAGVLVTGQPTIIHGEYYPHNILVRGDQIYPIDWESAAIGAGEIDLASLTEAWPAEIARQCEREYGAARWSEEPPADFERRLAAARAYLCFRWLGDQPEWTLHDTDYFEQLRAAGEELGII
jgi:hypothetical protein